MSVIPTLAYIEPCQMMKTKNYRLVSEFAAYVSHSLHPGAQAMEVSFKVSQFCNLHFLTDVKFTLIRTPLQNLVIPVRNNIFKICPTIQQFVYSPSLTAVFPDGLVHCMLSTSAHNFLALYTLLWKRPFIAILVD